MKDTNVGEYYKKRNLMERLSKELQELEDTEGLKRKLGIEFGIKELLRQYELEPQDLLEIVVALYPDSVVIGGDLEPEEPRVKEVAPAGPANPVDKGDVPAERPKKPVTPRRLKRYTNPLTGDVVETRGSNHRTLNAWRQRYGAEAVDSWWVFADVK